MENKLHHQSIYKIDQQKFGFSFLMQSLHQIESVKALPRNPAEHASENVTTIKQCVG